MPGRWYRALAHRAIESNDAIGRVAAQAIPLGSGEVDVSEVKQRFQASLQRCLASKGFMDRFYELFLSSSPEVQAKFEGTDFDRQKRMVRDSFRIIEVLAESPPGSLAWSKMGEIARAHDRQHRDIRPELYDLWLDCLVAAVAEHDPEASPEVELAWRTVLAPGIEYMRSSYPGS
jgi:hemoglobin-like flavoprotein